MPVSNQGVDITRYMLIPRTLLFLTWGDKILLVKGSKSKRLWANLYNGVGGHIEQGEDIFAAAARELFEETGLSSPDLWLCGILTVDTQENPGVVEFIFRGRTFTEGKTVSSSEGELEWVTIPQIMDLPLVPDLPQLLPKIIDHMPGEPPFFVHSDYDQDGNLRITFS